MELQRHFKLILVHLIFRVHTVMENLEKSCYFKKVISRTGKLI